MKPVIRFQYENQRMEGVVRFVCDEFIEVNAVGPQNTYHSLLELPGKLSRYEQLHGVAQLEIHNKVLNAQISARRRRTAQV